MEYFTHFELDETGNIKIENGQFTTSSSKIDSVKSELAMQSTVKQNSILANTSTGIDLQIFKKSNIEGIRNLINQKVKQIPICYPNAIVSIKDNKVFITLSVLNDSETNFEQSTFSIQGVK